jgi:hypothetical protein
VSVYKRGRVYWYDFWFQGQRHRGSTKLRNKTAADSSEAIAKLSSQRVGQGSFGANPVRLSRIS